MSIASLLFIPLACDWPRTPPLQEIRQYSEAVRLAPQDPAASRALCLRLQPGAAKDDCILNTIDQQAETDPVSARETCEALTGWMRGECVFIVADKTLEPSHCSDATPYEQYCYSHIFSGHLKETYPEGIEIAGVESTTRSLLSRLNFPADWDTAWELSWSYAFSALETPPPEPCGPVNPSVSNKACRAAYARRWPEAPPR